MLSLLVLAANPVSPYFQGLLHGIGWVLAFIYRYIPNYGVAIILLTLGTRVLLFPLVRKQIHSMQAMQTLQPKIKEIQKKYKGDRQKLNEEMMKLYQEYGYNPLSGCFPLLAQFPVLIALFAVLSFPKGLAHIPHSNSAPFDRGADSRLYVDIVQQHTSFLGMNLVCSAREAGHSVDFDKAELKRYPDLKQKPGPKVKSCGKGAPVRIPYYLMLVLMTGTTYYQQRQMQRASPAGASQQQQQMLARMMPLFFLFIGFSFPVGLVLYWSTTNGVSILQQHFMLRRRGDEPEPMPKKTRTGDGARRGLLGRMADLQKNQTASKERSDAPKPGLRGEQRSRSSDGKRGQPLPRAGSSGGAKRTGQSGGQRQKPGGQGQQSSGSKAQSGQGGARSGRDRKKRRKR